ncbi:hypothetical protein SCUCBS95973_001686 [Sporothrix curviconia]|uniref:Dimethylaniline monooxygenase n=1 Tax=Sporothrix curviconia TaxID=1260050 RepID=A0ABP0B0M1_9PEZI
MARVYSRVAVIGAGPSGIAAARALREEGNFEAIRVFERKAAVGGMWAYEPRPEMFQSTTFTVDEARLPIPEGLLPGSPVTTPPAARERLGTIGAAYDSLDTNAGARTMAFTHTPLPVANSAVSERRFGVNNSSRPRHTVLSYLEELARPVLEQIVFSTHVEALRKQEDGTWLLTARRETEANDIWSQQVFDAVIVASGHFNVASVPRIDGLVEAAAAVPSAFEHSKSFRHKESYQDKRVVVVGGGISAADLMEDLHTVAHAPLYVSRRGNVGFLESAWKLPNVEQKPTIQSIRLERTVETNSQSVILNFSDGSSISHVDKVLFATGYRLAYPFLPYPDGSVTPHNRLAGFYQHIFCMDDPSLAVIGQVRAAISLRVYEYQAVAVARFLGGHAAGVLPTVKEQRAWEQDRLAYKGPSELFHEIKPDFAEYYSWMRLFAGAPAPESIESGAYELPPYEDWWVDSDVEVLIAKGRYWDSLCGSGEEKRERLKQQQQK